MPLREYYNTGDDTSELAFYDPISIPDKSRLLAQTFTPSTSFTVTSVKVKIYRVGNPLEDIYSGIGIYATSGGVPVWGSELAGGIYYPSLVTDNTDGEWITINLSEQDPGSANLVAGTEYALLLVPGADMYLPDFSIGWRVDASSPSYSGVAQVSYSDPISWSNISPNSDFMFEIWSGSVTYPTDTLARVSGITRSFWSGKGGQAQYQCQITTGGILSTYVSPVSARTPPSVLPKEDTKATQYPIYVQWVNMLITSIGMAGIMQKWGHIPTYEEWLLIQAGGK
jgi:hypothetical protein